MKQMFDINKIDGQVVLTNRSIITSHLRDQRFLASFFFLVIFVSLSSISFVYYGTDLLEIKYLTVNIIGSILLSFLLIYSYFNFKKSLILLYILIPIFTWYKSVFFITIDFFLLDPFLIILIFFFTIIFLEFVKKAPYANRFFFFLTLIFLSRFVFSLFSLDNMLDVYIVIIEHFEPFLFVAITFMAYSLYSSDMIEIFNRLIKGFLLTSFVILLTEMLLRSGGKPWLFLIYGGRRGYAGTMGDLTAGLGEPVMMGLFATFLIFYFILYMRNNYIIIYLAGLILLSVAKSAVLAFLLIFILLYFSLKRRLWFFFAKKYFLIGLFLSMPLLYVIYRRLLGIGDGNNLTSMSLSGVEISSDLNLIRNITSAISWADPYVEIDWYVQFILLPLIGGINNVMYLEKNIFVFLMGIVFLFYIFFQFAIKGNYFTRSVTISFSLIYCYYGAFAGTTYSYFYEPQKFQWLGYVPRNEPIYLLIIILVMLEISKNKLGAPLNTMTTKYKKLLKDDDK